MVDGIFIELMPESGWRYMLGLAAVPSLIMLFGFLFFLPESPRWLAMSGQSELALTVLKTLRDTDQDAEDEMRQILRSVGKGAADGIYNESVEKDEGDGRTALECSSSFESTLENSDVLASTDGVFDDDDDDDGDDSKDNFLDRFARMVSDAPTRRALILGCGLMMIQQCSGVNTYVPYNNVSCFRSRRK
jgi:SP family myo-inositol transporter-like MFS transporter 13